MLVGSMLVGSDHANKLIFIPYRPISKCFQALKCLFYPQNGRKGQVRKSDHVKTDGRRTTRFAWTKDARPDFVVVQKQLLHKGMQGMRVQKIRS